MELSVVARAGRDRDRFVDPEGIDQRIKVLREQGLGRAEIGRVLSISRGKVNHSVNMLIKSGEIPKKEGGRGSKEEIMAFDAQVKSLVAGERRVNIKELSERMRASYMKVRSSIHRLVEAKELPAELLGKGRQNFKRTQISLDIELSPKRGRSDIDSQVAELRAQGLFEIEIAEQLNEPRGKIRYAIRKLLKEGSISKLSESHPEFRKKQEYTKTRLGPGPTRIKFRELLQQHMEEHPDQRIELADYARELGISRERTRQLYRKLSSEMKVPGLKSRLSRAEAELVDEQVTILRRKGLSREEIARQVGINENMVGVSLRRSRKKLVVRVKDLYGQGVAETRIAKITGEAKGRIQHIIKKLVEAGEVQRLRVVIRREEYPGFLARVAGLRNANLTDQKIADQLKKPLANIRHAVRLLIARGEIQPRRHMRFSREERRILRDRVKQLRNQGFGNKEIEIALNIPRWKVSHLAAELIKAGEIRRIRRESTHTTTEQINA